MIPTWENKAMHRFKIHFTQGGLVIEGRGQLHSGRCFGVPVPW